VVASKELGRRSVKERWADVWSSWQEAEDVRELERRVIKRTLESAMVVELELVLGARPYGRSPGRRGYRNGSRTRALCTGAGLIPDLRVPRATGAEYRPTVLTAYQRRARETRAAIRDMDFEGLATRRIGPILEQLFGRPVSAATVSTLTRQVEAEVRAFHRRPLPGTCRFLFLDGVVVSSRHGHKRSTLITTNTAFSDWGNILYNTTIAAAIADRLVENSEAFLLGGDSLRKANKPSDPPAD
jgi:transposase-like protein